MRSALIGALACSSLLLLASCGNEQARDGAVEATSTHASVVQGVETGNLVGNVGTLAFQADGVWYWFGCSGTLVHPRVFLTAGHCIDGVLSLAPAAAAGVTFAPEIDLAADPWAIAPLPATTRVHAGTAILHPGFDSALFLDAEGNWLGEYSTNPDVGIVLLDKPVRGIVPAAVAPVGTLDRLAKVGGVPVGLAGYGLSWDCFDETCPVVLPDWGTRRFGTMRFERVTPMYTVFTEGPSRVSSFDSGGPFFPNLPALRERMVPPRYVPLVLATATGWVQDPTSYDAIAFRMDLKVVHEFLDPYLRLPVH